MHRQPVLFFLLILFSFQGQGQLNRYSFSQPKMGSPFNIVVYTGDSLLANSTVKECFQLVDSFVNIYSDYIDSSELSKLSNFAGDKEFHPVSPALFDIINISQKAFRQSNGAFDITIGPLVKYWRMMRREKKFPAASEIVHRKQMAGFRGIRLNKKSHRIKLRKEGMQLDLGGIAQGYIADKVLERLRSRGISIALVDVSGDIAAGGAPPGRAGWTIGINLPQKTLELQDKKLSIRNIAVSTSGDVYQFIEHEGKRYSHIVDPRTGYGVTNQRNVTIIAGDATTADWLATSCSILSLKQCYKLAKRMHAEFLIAALQDGKLVTWSTKGFENYTSLPAGNFR